VMRASVAAVVAAYLVLLPGCPVPDPDDDDVTADDDDATVDDDDSASSDDDDTTADDDDTTADDDDATEPPLDLKQRMLVLYNADEPESQALAEHYVAARGLPESALCPTWPGAIDVIEPSVYSAGVATPLLDCIDAQWDHWLIFVTTWGMPYRVSGAVRDIATPANIVPASLDALLTRPHHHDDLPLSPGFSPYARDGASMTGTWEEGVPIDEWRDSVSDTFYLVSRLDGATPLDAQRLVDDAIAAEAAVVAGELTGTTYVDRGWQPRTDADDFGSYQSVEWDLTRLAQLFEAAGFDVVYDENGEEIGTEPAPLEGPDALYYGGWYSFNNYNDVWDWNFGSISLHFDSCSACDPRGGSNWSANVLQRGAVATMGAVAEPYVAGLMSYDQFFLYLFQGFSFVEAAYMSTPVAEWMAVFLGDPLYRPYGEAPLIEPGWVAPAE